MTRHGKGCNRQVDITEPASPRLGDKRPLEEDTSPSPAKTIKFNLKPVTKIPGTSAASVFSQQPSGFSAAKKSVLSKKKAQPLPRLPIPEPMDFSTPEKAPLAPVVAVPSQSVSKVVTADLLEQLKKLSPERERDTIKQLLAPYYQNDVATVRFSTFNDLARFTHRVSKLLDYKDSEGMAKVFLQLCAERFRKSRKANHTPDHLALFANSLAKLKDNDVIQHALIELSEEILERDLEACPGGRYRWGAIDFSRVCNGLGKVMPVELVAEALEKIALEVQRRGKKHQLTYKNGWEIWDFTQIVCALGKVDRMKARDTSDESGKTAWKVAEAMDAMACELLDRYRNKQWPGKEKVNIRDLQMLAGGFAHPDLRTWSHYADETLLMLAKQLSEQDFSSEMATTKRLCELAVSLSHCNYRSAEQQVVRIAREYLDRLPSMEKQKLPQTVSVLSSLCRLSLDKEQVELGGQILDQAIKEEKQLAESALTRDQIYWHLTLLHFARFEMARSSTDVSKLSRKARQERDNDPQRGQLMQWQLNMIRRYWRDTDMEPEVKAERTVSTTSSNIQREVYSVLKSRLPGHCRIRQEAEIDSFPVDILLPDEKVVVEVDGRQHFIWPDQDRARDPAQPASKPVVRAKYRFVNAMIESLGYTVFRVNINEAKSEAVRNELSRKIRSRIGHHKK
ncbi:DUF559 domain-containing protein [Endozoicomonas arenosclerae]|uniref:DUF559 domain-containing protein n=1 Tax=Endozoicomonas arenosclerae TaxID=1633495 RepID=UPI0012946B17|nr:DUF559 domain-containing protein [Endozoicomonas arenosclerae]